MPKSCLDCGHCKVNEELRPLNRRNWKFKHKNPNIEVLLNSRIIPGKVYCERNMWCKSNGDEFAYKNFAQMMERVKRLGVKGHLAMAEGCTRYEHG